MAIPKTARMEKNLGKKAVVNQLDISAPFQWLAKGISDFLACPTLAIFYGIVFTVVTYGSWSFLSMSTTFHDVSTPLLAIIILVLGPITAMSLYESSRKLSNGETPSLGNVIKAAFKTNGGCPSIFLSVILMVLAIGWMSFSPLIYAVFNTGSLNIVSEDQTVIQSILAEITSGQNMGFVITYAIFTGVLAWIAFMISWFSFPMVLDRDVDPFTAALSSLSAAMKNKLVMIVWIPIVGAIILAAMALTYNFYFAGLIIVIPVIAHATWHAYKSMIADIK